MAIIESIGAHHPWKPLDIKLPQDTRWGNWERNICPQTVIDCPGSTEVEKLVRPDIKP